MVAPQTADFIDTAIKSRPFLEQAYRSCLGVLNLVRKHPYSLVEMACQSALETRTLSYRAVKEELEWLKKQPSLPTIEALPVHTNIRGHEYYQ